MQVFKDKKAGIQTEASCIAQDYFSNFVEYRILRSDLPKLGEILLTHKQDEILVATVTP